MKRKSISKKLRFEVFKRDGFTCQYCGSTPPNIILEPDHINPICNGGGNEIDNLITSCFDCNRGKSGALLTSIPKSLSEKSKEIQERELQIAGYRKAIQSSLDRIENDMWEVANILMPGSSENGMRNDWLQSIKRFNEKLPLHEVINSAEIARAKFNYSKSNFFPYFCGVCWSKIKEVNNG